MSDVEDDVPKVSPASFFRYIAYKEGKESIRATLKHRMWMSGREHAVLLLENGRLAVVSGGSHGMTLEVRDGKVVVEVEGVMLVVRKLLWHIHPQVTGPSDADFAILRLLRQRSSVVYELGGEPEGTFYKVDLDEEAP